MSINFKDETAAAQVMAGGSAGSWEFGAATPSTTAGVISVDGILLNLTSTFLLANSLADSTSANRTNGSVTVPAGEGNTVNIDTSSKSDYTVASWPQNNGDVYVNALTTTAITLINTASSSISFTTNYSWI